MLVADFVGATRLGIKGLEMSRHATQPRAVLGTVDMHGAPTSPAPYRPRAADVFNHLATATTFGGGKGEGEGGIARRWQEYHGRLGQLGAFGRARRPGGRRPDAQDCNL